ncbi:hypothetical protein HOY34_21260 [Xinfangfangia sp. D13-10-4-6]|uniref:hypothetical protein n=1 Tax=Pseudogemmobacter hezensis TaxID=2737662 RepID=UPI001552A74A|nr:hypothetical protein [Pseudogemmobacter hezensis]NPD17711.1 hypothetical protein [Pseudogemmobacter hezensis]
MRKLKCTSCGGGLTLGNTPEGHVVGTCAHCQAQYVIDARGRSHVVVEHRLPPGFMPASAPSAAAGVRRRALIGGGVAIATLGLGLPMLGRFLAAPSPEAQREAPFREVFNVGGSGAQPGQFRGSPADVRVDSLGRALVRDTDNRYYLFAPDGGFLSHFPRPLEGRGSLIAFMPDGDLVVNASKTLARIDVMTGAVKAQTPGPDYVNDWTLGAAQCVTPEGGIAIYRVPDALNPDRRSLGYGSSVPGEDVLILLDRNLRETRRLSGLLTQAIAADPMVEQSPAPVSIAMDGNGSFYLYVIPREDHDARGGVFEFNADGRFQRRIQVEQAYFGEIVTAPDNSLWLADSWMTKLQHITAAGVKSYETAGLGQKKGQGLGNILSVASYPDGSLALLGNDRLLRAEVIHDA